jgi:hypothetical protein
MKKIMLLLAGGALLFLGGCETTREISLGKDGGGTMVTVTDMSSLIGFAKMSAKADELNKIGEEAIDTTFSLASMADSIPGLSQEERDFVKAGMLGISIDIKNDKFITRLRFPFTDPAQISKLDKLSAKVIQQVLREKLDEAEGGAAGTPPGMEDGMPEGSIDDYFTVTYSKGLIEKKLITEKYNDIDQDEGMKAVKQMAGMGMGNTTIVINFPGAVKKAEGKNLVVSDDGRKVTIKSNAEDFFDDGTSLEFRIEY